MSRFKTSKNYARLLNNLNFTFPGLPKIPRAPDAYSDRDYVDVHIARRRLELLHLLPVVDLNSLRQNYVESTTEQYGSLDRHFLSSLMADGYSSVVDELTSLAKEEEKLLDNCTESGRLKSFTEDKLRMDELVQGLISCAEAEKSNVPEKVRVRKSLGERMIQLGDFWLARKMFVKAFSYVDTYEDASMDKLRVELWCLLSYVCIYYEESQQIGYDLPAKCLVLARSVCQDKDWKMPKSVMSILIPKVINVYGLRNDWFKMQADFMSMYTVVTSLLHVLQVKLAKYWQQELQSIEQTNRYSKTKLIDAFNVKEHIACALTCALAYADEIGQKSAFITTALRRGMFFEDCGEWEKAMEDFNAMYLLSVKFEEKDAMAIALNRIGHNNKIHKKCEDALENFVNEWEISSENDFAELKADALLDLGFVLLEEGQTWEADECISQAHSVFHETKQVDTPNDLDDLSWAMMGVTRGQHLWGRYSTLIRSQERSRLNAVNEWKSSRKGFPLASMPQNWYHTHMRSDFEQQYKAMLPVEETRKYSIKKVAGIQFDLPEEDTTRRLFEFTRAEVQNRPTIWLHEKGFKNIFDFINASDKPRIIPEFRDSFERIIDFLEGREPPKKVETVMPVGTYEHRKSVAQSKESGLANKLRKSAKRMTISSKMNEWMRHDYRHKSWSKPDSRNMADRKTMLFDQTLAVGERLMAFMDDMEDLQNLYVTNTTDDDESEDTELSKGIARPSAMTPALMEEFKNFDENEALF